MIKTFGDVGMGRIYFAHGKHMNFGTPEEGCYRLRCAPHLKFIF